MPGVQKGDGVLPPLNAGMASDTEDEDLKTAIALSLTDADLSLIREPEQRLLNDDSETPAHQPASSMLGLDRAAMERERMARIASRKRQRDASVSPPPARSPRKAPKIATTTHQLPSGARLNTFSSLVQQDQQTRKTDAAHAASAKLKARQNGLSDAASDTPAVNLAACQGGLKYPNGTVKKTWAFGHERNGHDVKIEEVLEPQTLKTALLSAFQWDMAWVMSKLKVSINGGRTKCVFVMQAKEESLKQQMLENTEEYRSFLRLCFPYMGGQVNCMHSKLMLLFHEHKLRIAIPTANLLNFDWGETGMMENTVFMIDLPRLKGDAPSRNKLTPFGEELIYFLKKQSVDQDVRDGVLNFDFSATSNMAFVHTAGGTSYAADAERTGLPGLARAVRSLGLQTEDLEIDFAASSIGSLNDEFLRLVHSAAKGEDAVSRATATASTAKSNFFNKPANLAIPVVANNIRDKLRIYFPTHETVTASTAGAAGTICLNRKWYEASNFPRSVFRDYISKRRGLLSHNKILLARGRRRDKDVAWVYVGSANVSESAWGKLTEDKRSKGWKVNARNWECGVVLPVFEERLKEVRSGQKPAEHAGSGKVGDGEDSETESEDGASENVARGIVGMEVFDGVLDIPFRHPSRTYDGRQPWYFQEHVQ